MNREVAQRVEKLYDALRHGKISMKKFERGSDGIEVKFGEFCAMKNYQSTDDSDLILQICKNRTQRRISELEEEIISLGFELEGE